MKTYYIYKPRNFANEYSLCWVEQGSKEEKEIIEQGWERITRKEAVQKCINERWSRKNDQAFSGYGDDRILPYTIDENETDRIRHNPNYFCNNYYSFDGYIYERL